MNRTITPVLLAAFLTLAAACSRPESAPRQTAATTAEAAPRHDFKEIPSPAGAGAAEPFLFKTRTGVGLSWLEPVPDTDRHALRMAVFHEGAWSAPRTIVDRNDLFVNWADFPSVIEDEQGTLFAHWLQKSGSGKYAYDVRMASSADGGATWGQSFLLNRDGKEGEHGFVTLAALPGGGVGATWLDGRNMTMDHEDHGNMTLRYASVAADGTLRSDEQLDDRTCECCATGMTIAADGPVIVYRDRSTDEIRDIAWVRRDSAGWTSPRLVRADGWKINGCPVNGPQIDSLDRLVVTAWFTAAGEKQRVYAAFSEDAGATFGREIVVDDGKPAGRVDVVLLDADTALVSWLEQTTAGAEIRARRVSRNGKPEPSIKIADSATARGTGFTRLVRAGGEVWFAWTEQSADSRKVHVGRGTF